MEVKPQPTSPGDGRQGKSIYGYDRLAGGRQLPFSEEAEQAVLGAAMVDKEAVGLAREKIDFGDFYRLEHQLIFRAMCSLYENDQAIDPITVGEQLRKAEVIIDVQKKVSQILGIPLATPEDTESSS